MKSGLQGPTASQPAAPAAAPAGAGASWLPFQCREGRVHTPGRGEMLAWRMLCSGARKHLRLLCFLKAVLLTRDHPQEPHMLVRVRRLSFPCKCCVGFPCPTVSSLPGRSAPAVPGSCFRPQGSMGESVVTLRVDTKREASLEEPSSPGRAVNTCATEERLKPPLFGGQRNKCSPLLKELIISFGFTFEGSGMPCKNTGRVKRLPVLGN